MMGGYLLKKAQTSTAEHTEAFVTSSMARLSTSAERATSNSTAPVSFPANLLVSDEALNDHSKYFDLDAWADTLPFLAVPKASKEREEQGAGPVRRQRSAQNGWCARSLIAQWGSDSKRTLVKNHHPTVKPLKLMSYLITLTTREGDTVLDPFVGSGTTVVAAKQLNRTGIGIEKEPEYAEIAEARVDAAKYEKPIEQTNLLEQL
jgi:hypothetical protein